jgi:hypothetical protein
MAITVLGFAVAIWQIVKVKRAAVAARDAALRLARQVRSRELLAKLGDAHNHFEAARNHLGGGERQLTVLRLELASTSIIEAREISQTLNGRFGDLSTLILVLGELAEQLSATEDPLTMDPFFTPLQVQFRRVSERIQRVLAQSRYAYDLAEEQNG